MQPLVAVILVGVPLAWLVGFAAYVYVDAPRHGMNRRKWALIAFVVPLFGLFAYLFERVDGQRELLAEALNVPAATDPAQGTITAVESVRDSLGSPSRLRDIDGIDRSTFDAIAQTTVDDALIENVPPGLDPEPRSGLFRPALPTSSPRDFQRGLRGRPHPVRRGGPEQRPDRQWRADGALGCPHDRNRGGATPGPTSR